MIQRKLCMIGDFSVGKTSLVRHFVSGIYSDKYLTTVGVKIDRKVVEVGGQDVTLVLWDLAGDDAFQKLKVSYVRGSGGFIVVADGTRAHTLDKAEVLKKEMESVLGPVPFVLAVNKVDLREEWEVEEQRLEALSARGWDVVMSSAKTGEQVEELFVSLAGAMVST